MNYDLLVKTFVSKLHDRGILATPGRISWDEGDSGPTISDWLFDGSGHIGDIVRCLAEAVRDTPDLPAEWTCWGIAKTSEPHSR